MKKLRPHEERTSAGWKYENMRQMHEQLQKVADIIDDNKNKDLEEIIANHESKKLDAALNHLADTIEETDRLISDYSLYPDEMPFSEVIDELAVLLHMTAAEREAYLSNKKRRLRDKHDKSREKTKVFEKIEYNTENQNFANLTAADKLILFIEKLTDLIESAANAIIGDVDVSPDTIEATYQLRSLYQSKDLQTLVRLEDVLGTHVLEPYLHSVAKILNTTWEMVAVGDKELAEKNAFSIKNKPIP